MAFETMLIKVKTKIFASTSPSPPPPPSSAAAALGVVSFEMAGVMSKLVQLWRFLSDNNNNNLNDIAALEGVRKIVSNDDTFLAALACAETLQTLRLLSHPISRAAARSSSAAGFPSLFRDFADSGRDPRGWALPWREMDAAARKMDRLAAATALLRREMEDLAAAEGSLRKGAAMMRPAGTELHHQKILWRRQEVKYLKEKCLWSRSFDYVALILARSIFTVLARAKLVFGLQPPPRSPLSAAVHPSDSIVPSVPGINNKGFLEENTRVVTHPPETTLGAAGLAVHYAGVVMAMERMIKSPQLVGPEARDDLYSMLPGSVRASLRARLRGVGFSATDPGLAAEWRAALARILTWLSPLAHNMIRWQNERSLEQSNSNNNHHGSSGVLLLQTLFFANTHKAEAAITELLVGLNYIWRFDREMTAKAFFESHLNNTNNKSNNTNNALFVNNNVVPVN